MENWFDYFKDRRFVPIFFITLVVLFAGPLVIGIILQVAVSCDLLKYWPFAAAVTGVCLLILIGRGIAQARARRLNRYKSSPLSRDELAKARSKLTTKPNFKKI
jgi:hypothetical protein